MTLSDRILGFLGRMSQRGDIVIAILLLTAVVMMLIPLPTFLVDGLITANIAISVLILLASFYVTSPLQFSSLPAVILIATLFRLAITITTTRLILLNADAGDIIATFGHFVVGGSVGVGLVVFFIITAAQFIVIAKGSERVAEVAARFTLDALPGKQMSIDAELRNGDIDQAEARRLRRDLERESQLYGAMDGAMKFVKGDVIAGIIIILVNLIGGISIGMIQHDMSMGESAATYTLLTVGDGLVAQIPALLVAIAAGTMVTRVGAADGDGDLGRQITAQLLRDSRALSLAAAIMFGLALVPGFPLFAFLLLGIAFAAGAWVTHSRQRNAAAELPVAAARDVGALRRDDDEAADAGTVGERLSLENLQSSYRIVVHLGADLAERLDDRSFNMLAGQARHAISADLGVEIPPLGRYADPALDPRRIRIDLEGAPILDAEIPEGRILALADAANLELIDVAFETGVKLPGEPRVLWVEAAHAATLRNAGLLALDTPDICGRWLENVLRLYAGHFIGVQETRKLLSTIEKDYADLVREAQAAVPLQKLSEILRRLVAESVPIRNLRLILEALVEWGQREQDGMALTEHVRVALKRQISFRAADRNNIIAAYVLQRSAEDILRRAVHRNANGAYFNMSDDEAQRLVKEIERAYSKASMNVTPIVLAATDVRRNLRNLLMHNGNELTVLSYNELASEFNVQPLATISGRVDSETRGGSRALPASDGDLQRQAAP